MYKVWHMLNDWIVFMVLIEAMYVVSSKCLTINFFSLHYRFVLMYSQLLCAKLTSALTLVVVGSLKVLHNYYEIKCVLSS